MKHFHPLLGYTKGQKRNNLPKSDEHKNDLQFFKRARRQQGFYADLANENESESIIETTTETTTENTHDLCSETTSGETAETPGSQTAQPLSSETTSSTTTSYSSQTSSQTTPPKIPPETPPKSGPKTRKSRHDWMDPVVEECMTLGEYFKHMSLKKKYSVDFQ